MSLAGIAALVTVICFAFVLGVADAAKPSPSSRRLRVSGSAHCASLVGGAVMPAGSEKQVLAECCVSIEAPVSPATGRVLFSWQSQARLRRQLC
jgi:hypothetical protein